MATTKETDVLNAANFAVDEHNEKEGTSLTLDRVVLGVGYKKIYFMILKCTDPDRGSTGYYVAIVSTFLKKILVIFQHLVGWADVNYIESSTETQMGQLRVLAVDAVKEYNNEQKRSIKFGRVVAAQQLDGVDYRLIIVCDDGNYIKLYEVIEKRLKEFESLDLYNKQQLIEALKTKAGPEVADEWAKMQPEHVDIDSVTFGVLA